MDIRAHGREVLESNDSIFKPVWSIGLCRVKWFYNLGSNPDVYSRSVSLLHFIPYGYWTYSAFGFYSTYSSETQTSTVLNAHGWSSNIGIRADKTLSRDGNTINTLSGQFVPQMSKTLSSRYNPI